MNLPIKFFISILVMLGCIIATNAYELTEKDEATIVAVEEKLFPILDTKSVETIEKVLTRIDSIQENHSSEKIVALMRKLEYSIKDTYDIWHYAVSTGATPMLYTTDFSAQFGGVDGNTLNFDNYGEIDAVEHIAPEGTVFKIIDELENNIYQVHTSGYPTWSNVYVHGYFLGEMQKEKIEEVVRVAPSKEEIIKKLHSVVGKDYVWGGNEPDGIPKLLELFPPKSDISKIKKEQWTLTGLDCSGLLYWASNGTTLRNTSWLVEDDGRLDIAGKTLEEITPMLEPLDVIVRKGHMMIVLDEENTIESAVKYDDESLTPGVQIRKISDSLGNVMSIKTPVNNYGDVVGGQFVILRWFDKLY